MKMIRSNMKALEWPQNYIYISRHLRADNSVVSVWIWQKFELIQAFMHVLVTCKNEEVNALEWPQHFSHYKSMGIFPDAQGQLTPQSVIGSGRNSNFSEMLWLSLLPARMKKNQSRIKALEW